MRTARTRFLRLLLLAVVGVALLGGAAQAAYTNCVLITGPVYSYGAHCGYCHYYWDNHLNPDMLLEITTYHYHCTEGELTETTERHVGCAYVIECN